MHIILVMANSTKVRSLTDAEIEWLDTLTLSEAARTAYKGEVGRLSAFCATRGVSTIRRLKADHWTAYLSCLMEDRTFFKPKAKPLKPRSALQAARITRSFLSFCARRHWIDWDPAEHDLVSQIADAAELPAFTLEDLPERVRLVLTGELVAGDMREARQNLALGLGFWGALVPREIALLTVGNLHLPSKRRSCELHCSWRPLPLMLPTTLSGIWRRYRDFREERGQDLNPKSPLVASLRDGAALHPWSVWALMRSGDESEVGDASLSNTRLLRRVYMQTTTQDATRDVDVVRGQAGMPPHGPGVPAEPARRRILNQLHDATIVRLAA
ncbi:hypothetical protein CDO81_20700 [Roseateles puraquae]|uniref:Core-binding (CB) domain-containing protein n=2 Tax=Roseateles puraquae TaxID=431059 RepID=A0A254N5Q6_9BURK|nr:hypothetical protein CDO81_20700 [Roseateles puraquae]